MLRRLRLLAGICGVLIGFSGHSGPVHADAGAGEWTDTNLSPACVNTLREDVIQRVESESAAERYSSTKRLSVQLMAPGIHLERPVSYFYYAMPEYAVSSATALAHAGPKAAVAAAAGKAASDFSLGMLRDIQLGPVVVARKTAGASYQIGRWAYLRNHERYHRLKTAPSRISGKEAIAYHWDEHALQQMFVALELNEATNKEVHAPSSATVKHAKLAVTALEESDYSVGAKGGLGQLAYMANVAAIIAEALEPLSAYPPLRRYNARSRFLRESFQQRLTDLCGPPPEHEGLPQSPPPQLLSRRTPVAPPTASPPSSTRPAAAAPSSAVVDKVWFATSFSTPDYDYRWTRVNRDDRPAQKLTTSGGAVHIRRTGASGNGGIAYVSTLTSIPISSRTLLATDGVQVYHQDVRRGDGDNHGEHPLFVELVIERRSGATVRLRHAWNLKVANNLQRGDLIQRVFLVPRGQSQWGGKHYIQQAVPDASRIVEVRIGGAGWNFESKLGAIEISDR